MIASFSAGVLFEGSYELSLVNATTGIMTVIPDIVRYTVKDVNFAVQGTKRCQNASFETKFNNLQNCRIAVGFYDRCSGQGQLLERHLLMKTETR